MSAPPPIPTPPPKDVVVEQVLHNLAAAIEVQTPDVCWVFATAAYTEYKFRDKYPNREAIKISKQELVDKCNTNIAIGEAYGFPILEALEWVEKNGVCLEDDYPNKFTGVRQPPHEKPHNATIVHLVGLHELPGTEEIAIKEVLRKQVVAASFVISPSQYLATVVKPAIPYAPKFSDLLFYEGDPPRHAILFVGLRTTKKSASTSTEEKLQTAYIVRDSARIAPGKGNYMVKASSAIEPGECSPVYRVVYADDIAIFAPNP